MAPHYFLIAQLCTYYDQELYLEFLLSIILSAIYNISLELFEWIFNDLSIHGLLGCVNVKVNTTLYSSFIGNSVERHSSPVITLMYWIVPGGTPLHGTSIISSRNKTKVPSFSWRFSRSIIGTCSIMVLSSSSANWHNYLNLANLSSLKKARKRRLLVS